MATKETLAERVHKDTVENFKKWGCPPELVILYDAIPCTTTYALAWAGIREEWLRKGEDPLYGSTSSPRSSAT